MKFKYADWIRPDTDEVVAVFGQANLARIRVQSLNNVRAMSSGDTNVRARKAKPRLSGAREGAAGRQCRPVGASCRLP